MTAAAADKVVRVVVECNGVLKQPLLLVEDARTSIGVLKTKAELQLQRMASEATAWRIQHLCIDLDGTSCVLPDTMCLKDLHFAEAGTSKVVKVVATASSMVEGARQKRPATKDLVGPLRKRLEPAMSRANKTSNMAWDEARSRPGGAKMPPKRPARLCFNAKANRWYIPATTDRKYVGIGDAAKLLLFFESNPENFAAKVATAGELKTA